MRRSTEREAESNVPRFLPGCGEHRFDVAPIAPVVPHELAGGTVYQSHGVQDAEADQELTVYPVFPVFHDGEVVGSAPGGPVFQWADDVVLGGSNSRQSATP